MRDDSNSPASGPASLVGIEIRKPRRQAGGTPACLDAGTADDIGPSALLAYWKDCRIGERPPTYSSLDLRRIAFYWPGSVLFRSGVEGRTPQVERVFHGAASYTGTTGSDNYAAALPGTSAVSEWLLSVVRSVARNAEWTEQAEAFVGPGGARTVRCLVLPVGSDIARVEFVLCNVWSGPRPLH